jgi:rhodanese-related sulfurtransferase
MKSKIVYLFVITLLLTSCLENDIISTLDIQLNDSALLIKYIEDKGDFPNSVEAPALITAQEVYDNLTSLWILDIRKREDYLLGHIEYSINIQPERLLRTIDSLNNVQPLRRIVLVGNNGQESSYYNCLLRLAGYNNVFNLRFGMASWNNDFANDWFSALGVAAGIVNYNNTLYGKNNLTELPAMLFPDSIKSTEGKFNFRLSVLIYEGFNTEFQYLNRLSNISQAYVICYGVGRLYYAPLYVPYGEAGHPENTKWYQTSPLYEFRSSKDLQTLPSDKTIIVYSGDGHESACIVAYLRFLGYNAKTVLYGANQLFYPRLLGDPEIVKYAFSQSDVHNFPYVTGE